MRAKTKIRIAVRFLEAQPVAHPIPIARAPVSRAATTLPPEAVGATMTGRKFFIVTPTSLNHEKYH